MKDTKVLRFEARILHFFISGTEDPTCPADLGYRGNDLAPFDLGVRI